MLVDLAPGARRRSALTGAIGGDHWASKPHVAVRVTSVEGKTGAAAGSAPGSRAWLGAPQASGLQTDIVQEDGMLMDGLQADGEGVAGTAVTTEPLAGCWGCGTRTAADAGTSQRAGATAAWAQAPERTTGSAIPGALVAGGPFSSASWAATRPEVSGWTTTQADLAGWAPAAQAPGVPDARRVQGAHGWAAARVPHESWPAVATVASARPEALWAGDALAAGVTAHGRAAAAPAGGLARSSTKRKSARRNLGAAFDAAVGAAWPEDGGCVPSGTSQLSPCSTLAGINLEAMESEAGAGTGDDGLGSDGTGRDARAAARMPASPSLSPGSSFMGGRGKSTYEGGAAASDEEREGASGAGAFAPLGAEGATGAPVPLLSLLSEAGDWRGSGGWTEREACLTVAVAARDLARAHESGHIHWGVSLESIIVDLPATLEQGRARAPRADGENAGPPPPSHRSLAELVRRASLCPPLGRSCARRPLRSRGLAPPRSAAHLAPELAAAAGPSCSRPCVATPASDCWALGVLAFRLLSGGHLPFGHHGLCWTSVPNLPRPTEPVDALREWVLDHLACKVSVINAVVHQQEQLRDALNERPDAWDSQDLVGRPRPPGGDRPAFPPGPSSPPAACGAGAAEVPAGGPSNPGSPSDPSDLGARRPGSAGVAPWLAQPRPTSARPARRSRRSAPPCPAPADSTPGGLGPWAGAEGGSPCAPASPTGEVGAPTAMSHGPRPSEAGDPTPLGLPAVGFSPEASALVLALLSADPAARLTASEALRSPWLAPALVELEADDEARDRAAGLAREEAGGFRIPTAARAGRDGDADRRGNLAAEGSPTLAHIGQPEGGARSVGGCSDSSGRLDDVLRRTACLAFASPAGSLGREGAWPDGPGGRAPGPAEAASSPAAGATEPRRVPAPYSPAVPSCPVRIGCAAQLLAVCQSRHPAAPASAHVWALHPVFDVSGEPMLSALPAELLSHPPRRPDLLFELPPGKLTEAEYVEIATRLNRDAVDPHLN